MVLPKRCIDIRPHAFHRSWERLQLPKAKATATIRRILRRGTWYESPDQHGEFMVLGRAKNRPTCLIAVIEGQQVVVTTVFPLRNTSRVRAYQQHSRGISASDVTERFGLPA